MFLQIKVLLSCNNVKPFFERSMIICSRCVKNQRHRTNGRKQVSCNRKWSQLSNCLGETRALGINAFQRFLTKALEK